jgi:NTP pyrophosphatase (non-canonical NTP hydrolase)
MSQTKDTSTGRIEKTEQDPRLKKLRHIEELAEMVHARWRRSGSLSRIESAVKELLAEIKKPAR